MNTLTDDEIMEAFQEAYPGHDLHSESLEFARAVERRLIAKRPDCGDKDFHCGDPECDACIPQRPADETFWMIERGSNQGQSPTCWWSGRDNFGDTWSTDVHAATKFASKEAAQAIVQQYHVSSCAITSHNFIAPALPA